MVYLLTPTGGRPEGLALLAEYINAQTWRGAAHWVIVDDCLPLSPIVEVRAGIEIERISPGWVWRPGMNTQAACMAAGLKRIPAGATCIVLEDDDLYLPDHIGTVLAGLEGAELVGEKLARYYNVATCRWKEIPSDRHASLAATGCRGAALAKLREVCAAGSLRIDMDLWQGYTGRKALLDSRNVVGIKGLPGRIGIGVGHRDGFGFADSAGDVLVNWAGAARAKAYSGFRRT